MRRAALALLTPLTAMAQVQQLWDSPAASVSQNLGLTRVEVTYHRPAVKGRTIWGDLVPFGQVWRAGANDATTIFFGSDVKVAGNPVPKGTYALFLQPGKERWTVILNKDSAQWGAYFYKADRDQLRFEVTPRSAPHQERLAYSLDLADRDTALVSFRWEKLEVSFPVTAEVDQLYLAHLKEELAKAERNPDRKTASYAYFLAGKYHFNLGHLAEAEPLLAQADKLHESFSTQEWTARLRQKQGRLPEALALLAKAKAMATGKAPKEYLAGLDVLRAEWTQAK